METTHNNNKMENEIEIFVDNIEAIEVKFNTEEKKFFKKRNYFKFPDNQTLLIVKISRSKKPFYGVRSNVIEFANKEYENYFLILLTSDKVGWVFSKRKINLNIKANIWREAKDKNYKINYGTLLESHYFSSCDNFFDRIDEQENR